MNVLLIGDGDTKYGASHSLCQLAKALNEKENVDVSVIVNKDSYLTKQMRAAGCKVYVCCYDAFYQGIPSELWKLPIKYVVKGIKYWGAGKRVLFETKRLFDNNRFDIIHSNSSREDIGATLAKHYSIPLIWHIREFGDIDFRCYSYRRNYIPFMNENTQLFIAVSEAVKKHWIKKGIDENKIITVYNGVQISSLQVLNEVSSHICNLVIVGGLCETKGQLDAVEAVICLNKNQSAIEYHLDIIGSGDRKYISKIRRIIKDNYAEQSVRLLGYKTNVDEYLPHYHIGLMCSRNEAFGRVTAEYMMSGLAVVASDTEVNKELLRDGEDGLLYRYGDSGDLAMKIQEVYCNYTKFGGIKTREYAIKKYSSYANAENIYRVYLDVIAGRVNY